MDFNRLCNLKNILLLMLTLSVLSCSTKGLLDFTSDDVVENTEYDNLINIKEIPVDADPKPVDGKSVIKNIKADNGKTVLSFSEINKNDVMKIKKLLDIH